MPISKPLRESVLAFSALTQPLPDERLDASWNWRGYEEGVRFIHFRVLEELNWLSALLGANAVQSSAQRLLAQHHAAWWDLQSVLLGVGDDLLDKEPTPGEWTLRQTLDHLIEVEWAHTKISEFALQQVRAGKTELLSVPEEEFEPHFVTRGGFSETIFEGTLSEIQAFHETTHQKVLEAFWDVQTDELHQKAPFWEPEAFEIAFRLGRFSSHMAQHTVQIEKNLARLEHPLNEASHLHRRIFAALAGVEILCLGTVEEPVECRETTEYLGRLTGEAKSALEMTT